jgi:enoyl-CoA hydratase
MTQFSTILYEVRERVAVITLNRPEIRNAQNIRMINEIDAALDIAAADDGVRVVVLASAGPSFSAGHDMKATRASGEAPDEYELPYSEKRKVTETLFEHEYDKYVGKCLRLRDFPKPTLALTQGHCIAAGWMVASMCDLVIASDDAKFADPVVRMGSLGLELPVEFWDVGVRKAKELLFTGDSLSAADAHRLGFVNHVVPVAELHTFGFAMAARIAAMPPVAVRLTKLSMNRCLDQQGQANSFWQHYVTHQLAHQTEEFKTLRASLGTKDGVKGTMKDFFRDRDQRVKAGNA